MVTPTLGARALNRATLARQVLLERSRLSPISVVEQLVGLQAQTTQTWYVGLWSRIADFDPIAFGALLENREAVRISLMRSTIHLVSAGDALVLRPLVQSVSERGARSAYGKFWQGLDLDAVAGAARSLLEEQPLTFAELGARLLEDWPDRDASALAQVARVRLALVQTPPRGVWGKSGLARHTTIEAWLGHGLDATTPMETLVLRYLGAFGPASVRDAQAWCGATRLAEIFEHLRPQLATFRGDDGTELFDLPDAPRPAGDIPAPSRFLYDFDNLLRSHADRTRMIGHDQTVLRASKNGMPPSFVLIDGVVGASWSLTTAGGVATLEIRLLGPTSAAEIDGLRAEAASLLTFLAAGAQEARVSITPFGESEPGDASLTI